MSLKLIPPRAGKTPYWSVRGTHLGTYVDRTTKTAERSTAARLLKVWKEDIERGAIARPGEPTFLDAAVNYIATTGNDAFLPALTERFGRKPLREIDQRMLDEAAIALYPGATPQTRNRQLYTPMSAVLKHAGVDWKIRRPKGWRGSKRTTWLEPEQAFRLIAAARGIDREFEIFLILLLYTGLRLGEAIQLTVDRINLKEAFAYVPETKNGQPRAVFLPPVAVTALASLPHGLNRYYRNGQAQRAFRFIKCGRLYTLMGKVKAAGGADLGFVTFHVLRHTWATWMRRYAGLDLQGLVATDAWRDPASAARYAHVVASEESKKAALLPVDRSWQARRLAISAQPKDE